MKAIMTKRMTEMEEMELKNVTLLVTISKNKNAIRNIPNKNDLEDMTKEYKYKKV